MQLRIGRVVGNTGRPIGSNSCLHFMNGGQTAVLAHCQSFGSEVSVICSFAVRNLTFFGARTIIRYRGGKHGKTNFECTTLLALDPVNV